MAWRSAHGGPCRAEQCPLDLPLPGLGPAPSGGLGRGYCQVDEKLVDQLPRCWARARREPAMLGIRNGRQPQLDNTQRIAFYDPGGSWGSSTCPSASASAEYGEAASNLDGAGGRSKLNPCLSCRLARDSRALCKYSSGSSRLIPFMRACADTYGDAFTVRLFGPPMVFFSDPAAIKQIFTGNPDQLRAGQANTVVFKLLLGPNSILRLDAARHRHERKLLMPPFHGERMRLYGDMMGEIADRSIDTWPGRHLVSVSLAHAGHHPGHHAAHRVRRGRGGAAVAHAGAHDRDAQAGGRREPVLAVARLEALHLGSAATSTCSCPTRSGAAERRPRTDGPTSWPCSSPRVTRTVGP